MNCRWNKLKGLAILTLMIVLLAANIPSASALDNKLDEQVKRISSQIIILENGEELKISPHVTLINKSGKKRPFNVGLINSWEKIDVTMRKINNEMMIVEIEEVERNK